MKKVFNLFIIGLIMCFITVDVYADESCGHNQFWDPWNTTEEQKQWPIEGERYNFSSLNSVQRLAYNITQVQMENGNTLVIYGWAFNTGVNNTLGSNAFVDFKLEPQGGGEEIKFNVSYNTNENVDLKYWTCSRTPYQPNIVGGRCITNGTFTQSGSFRASVDLSGLSEDKKYTVKMKFNGPSGSVVSSSWQELGVSHLARGVDTVKNYKGNGVVDIKIDGWATRGEIRGGAQPLGDSGLYCNANSGSSMQERATATFARGMYDVTGIRQASRASTANVNLYAVPYKGKTVYVAAPDITFVPEAGGLKVIATSKSNSDDKPVDPGVTEPPAACEGEDIYTFHYFFNDETYGHIAGHHTTAIGQERYGDVNILNDILDTDSLTEVTTGEGGYVAITKDGTDGKYSLDWFLNGMEKAVKAPKKYYDNGNNEFFISYETWCDVDRGTCQEAKDELSFTHNDFKNKAVKAKVTINSRPNAENNGFLFDIDRIYANSEPTSASAKILISNDKPASTVVSKKTDILYQPAVYTVTLCKKKPTEGPDCSDVVSPAACLPGDSGTHAVYHESDNIKECTLNKDVNSGFTIIDENDTRSPRGISYGTVACKDDVDFYFPGSKETAAGQYFLLTRNNAASKIKGERSCATSQVSWSTFNSDLEFYEKSDQLPKMYNTFKDYLYIYDNLKVEQATENRVTVESSSFRRKYDGSGIYTDSRGEEFEFTEGSDGLLHSSCEDEDENEYEFTIDLWKIKVSTTPNGTKHEGVYGFTIEGVNEELSEIPCISETGSKKDTALTNEKSKIENLVRSYNRLYSNLLENYHYTVVAYNNMFAWAENVSSTKLVRGDGFRKVASLSEATRSGNMIGNLFSFNPTVTFFYKDRDFKIFDPYGTGYYVYNGKLINDDKSSYYWPSGASPNELYNNGSGGLSTTVRHLTNCSDGDSNTCREKSLSITFIQNSAIRRNESLEYEYNLPTVYTTIPDGKVTTQLPQKTHLVLDPEAAPVNINTPSGTYDYTISVSGLKDSLRKSSYYKNPNDDWGDEPPSLETSRFYKSGALGSGNSYVCNYKVTNDVYIPNERFNFFYRIIDPANINPVPRTLGYNWTDGRAETVKQRMQEREDDYQLLTNSSDTDKFVFTLTPPMMKELRRYNKDKAGVNKYADWESMSCSDYGDADGYHCRSAVLDCLVEEPKGNCSEVLGSLVNTSKDTQFSSKRSYYTFSDLEYNRRLLISKQNTIDGRGVTIP